MPHFFIKFLFLLSVALYASNSTAAECEHVIVQQYNGGFQGEIQITNTGSTPLPGFSVTWSYSDGTTIGNVWNADSTGTNPVTATSPVWLTAIPPGTTWSIGMNGTGGGTGVTITGDVCGPAIAQEAKLRLAKTWVDGITNDEITATTAGLLNNATISSTSTGSNTDTGNAVLVTIGETVTLPTETFISGAASDYNASDWVCDDAANSIVAPGSTLSLTPADADNTISCTLTNRLASTDTTTPVPSDLACEQVKVIDWGSGFVGEIQITNTSSSPIDDWTVTWGYADGTTVGNTWNSVSTGSNPVTATPPGSFNTLAPGDTFNVGFTANGPGNIDSITCASIAVVAESAALTLTNVLINDHGGVAIDSDWTLEANVAAGVAELSGTTGVNSSVLVAGVYELSATGSAVYTLTEIVCDSGFLNGTSLAIVAGDNINCTFYHDDLPVSLTLVKEVNNTAGTATADEWILDAALSGISVLNGTTGTAGVTSSSLSAGDYVLSESGGDSRYSLESLVCSAGVVDGSTNTVSLTNGEVAVCTFTNRDVVGDLSIEKLVDNTTPNIGDTINFTLKVANLGPNPVSDVVINDILPAGLSFVAGSMTGGDTQNQSAPNLEWTIDYLGVGVVNSLTLQFQTVVIAP